MLTELCLGVYMYMCVCVCVWYKHVYTCAEACAGTLQETKGEHWASTFLSPFTFPSWDRLSQWTWSLSFFWWGWQPASPSNTPVSVPHTQCYACKHVCDCTKLFNMSARNPHSGPHTWVARRLTHGFTSPAPTKYFRHKATIVQDFCCLAVAGCYSQALR